MWIILIDKEAYAGVTIIDVMLWTILKNRNAHRSFLTRSNHFKGSG